MPLATGLDGTALCHKMGRCSSRVTRYGGVSQRPVLRLRSFRCRALSTQPRANVDVLFADCDVPRPTRHRGVTPRCIETAIFSIPTPAVGCAPATRARRWSGQLSARRCCAGISRLERVSPLRAIFAEEQQLIILVADDTKRMVMRYGEGRRPPEELQRPRPPNNSA